MILEFWVMVIRVQVSIHIYPVMDQSIQYVLQVLYAGTSTCSEQCNYVSWFYEWQTSLQHSDGDIFMSVCLADDGFARGTHSS